MEEEKTNNGSKSNGRVTVENAETKLAEKAATDQKKFTKKEVTEIKAKKGKPDPKKIENNVVGTSCAICGLPILEKQSYKMLPADGKNSRRYYHLSTCSPGSPNWDKFRGGKSKMKVIQKATKPTKGKNPPKPKAEPKGNKYGHHGEIAMAMDELFEKGITKENFISTLSKRFPKAKMPWDGRLKRHIVDLANHGAKVSMTKNIYRISAK